jgi:putative redox protein
MSQKTLKEAFQKSIDAISTNPQNARMSFLAKTELVEGIRCTAKVRHFPPLTIDEPPELGGTNAGINPGELLMVALGTCQEIMYAACAALMEIPLNKVTIAVEGNLDMRGMFAMDESIPAGFSTITYETTLDSDADEDTLKKLVEMVESHCPLLDTLRRPVHVDGGVSIKKNRRMNRIR